MCKTSLFAAILMVAAFPLASRAQSGTYTCSNFQFIPPNTQYPDDSVAPSAVNDNDAVVGSYIGFDQEFGFTWFPGANPVYYLGSGTKQTSFNGLNDSNTIVGSAAPSYTSDSPGNGFVLVRGGAPHRIVHPNAQRTWATGINKLGEIVGYFSANGQTEGYLLSEGNFTDFYVPQGQPYDTQPTAINDEGVIVGWYTNFNPYGFIYQDGNFTLESGPPGTGEITFNGINDENNIAGSYLTTSPVAWVGFIFSGGTYNTVQIPNAMGTYTIVNSINNRGDIVGVVELTDATYPGFLGTGCHF